MKLLLRCPLCMSFWFLNLPAGCELVGQHPRPLCIDVVVLYVLSPFCRHQQCEIAFSHAAALGSIAFRRTAYHLDIYSSSAQPFSLLFLFESRVRILQCKVSEKGLAIFCFLEETFHIVY
jgi:hypothetical protein